MASEDPRPQPEPVLIDLDADGPPVRPVADTDSAPRSTRDRQLIVAMVAVLLLIVAGATFLGDADEPDRSGPPDEEAATTTDAPVGPSPEPTIDVEPTTGLADGDTLTLTLIPPPTDVDSRLPSVSICPPHERPDRSCLPLHAEGATAGQATSIHEIIVPRLLPTNTGSYDCASDGSCELRVAAGGAEATVPLAFDPDLFLLPVVAPRLADTEPVASGADVLIVGLDGTVVDRVDQCVTGLVDRCDGFGTYDQGYNPFPNHHMILDDSLRVRVFRRILTPDGVHDCIEDSPCEIRVRSRMATPRVQPVSVAFDAGAPADPSPIVRANPTIALTDGARVRIEIDGLGRHSTYTAALCPLTPPGGGVCPVLFETEASEDGTGTMTLSLPRRISTALQEVDCGIQPCVLRIAEGRFRTDVPVEFDITAPLRADPTFDLDPADPAAVGDRVVLRGSDLPVAHPDAMVTAWWALCDGRPLGPDEIDSRCGSPADVQASPVNPDGTTALTVVVPRPSSIRTWDGTRRLECSTCWLLVSTDTRVTTFGVPIVIE